MPVANAPHLITHDVLIVGGGIAGSLLALVLARAGRSVTVFDPNRTPKPMFRNEKLGEEQIAVLRELGALDCFESVCWPPQGHPHAYAENPKLSDCGAHHQDWVSAIRDAWPSSVQFVEAMVEQVETSPDHQTLFTRCGESYEGRLVVLASGRMAPLRESLGIKARTISPNHSVCLGFSVTADRFIPARIFTTREGGGIGYISIFPMPNETRVNIFSFRSLSHPWTRRMSGDPLGGLAEISAEAAAWLQNASLMRPSLMRRCEARSTDLYRVSGHKRDGVVLIGDTFHAPCPASGTGMLRVLYDVNILANIHIPQWLATPGMGRGKIKRFYADPAKRWLDRTSLNRSLRGRGTAVGTGPYWMVWRFLRAIKQGLEAHIHLPSASDRLAAINGRLSAAHRRQARSV